MAGNKRANGSSNDSMSTILGVDARLQGALTVEGSIRIDGHFTGIIKGSATVTIGPRGEVNGDVQADAVIIAGKVKGSVVGKSRMVLEHSAAIEGDIATKQLIISEGANLNGQCGMTESVVKQLLDRQQQADVIEILKNSRPQGATLLDEPAQAEPDESSD